MDKFVQQYASTPLVRAAANHDEDWDGQQASSSSRATLRGRYNVCAPQFELPNVNNVRNIISLSTNSLKFFQVIPST